MSTEYPGLPHCQATLWWCEMLHMYVYWQNRKYGEAEAMLHQAFSHMPAAVRCVWGDVSVLLDAAAARARYERMACNQRAELEASLWWLADPFFSAPGNERMVEHFARAVSLRLAMELLIPEVDGYNYALSRTRRATQRFSASDLAHAQLNPAPGSTEAELREFIGPHGLLERAFRSMRDADYRRANYRLMEDAMRNRIQGGPTGELPAARHQFVPSSLAIDSPLLAAASDWNLSPAVRRESALSPAGPIAALDAQHAFFIRGDSARLVVVSEPASHPFLAGTLMRAALAWARSPRDSIRVYRTAGGLGRYEFSPVLPRDSMVVSLEVFAFQKGAGRVRFGAAPPRRGAAALQLSDLLLFSPDSNDTSGAGLDPIIARALPTTALSRTQPVGVFWEMYGLAAGDSAHVTITATRVNSPRPDREKPAGAGRAARSQPSLTVGWTRGAAAGSAIEPDRVVLDISRLEPGYYVLELGVRTRNEAAAATRRVITVKR
jgi:hypothetical protein